MSNKPTLEIIIESAEFSKDYNYFITVQLDGEGEKRRTDVSNASKNPKFEANKFYLPLKYYDLLINQIVDRPDISKKDKDQGAGQASLLGEITVDLSPLTPDLNNMKGLAVKQKIELVRNQGDTTLIVGRLNADYLIPVDDKYEEGINDGTHLLPEMDIRTDFAWRIRAEIRSAVNLPYNRTTDSQLPSSYVEFGWAAQSHNDLNQPENARSATIDANRFPVWNNELIYYPPKNVTTLDGFLIFFLRDRYASRPLQRFTIPDLLLDIDVQDITNRSHLYISLTLEDSPQLKISESLANILITGVSFDPIPTCTNRLNILMTTGNTRIDRIPFKKADLKSDSHLVNVLISHKSESYSTFMSCGIKIPATLLQNQHNAIANFIVPRSFLDRNLTFFVVVRDTKVISDHSLANTIAGGIEVSEDLLKTSYFSKNHEKVPYKVVWLNDTQIYTAISHSRCVVEMSVRPVEELIEKKNLSEIDKLKYNEVKENIMKNNNGDFRPPSGIGGINLQNVPDKDKWDILSKELSQKQELIHRMMKEVDEKTEALKLTGAEVLDLRKQIKMLQNENANLRLQLGRDEQMQVESLVTQEIHKMSLPELKSKIIKLAQSYRAERMRNEEYEKALKQAQTEISKARKISLDLENLQKVHADDEEKYLQLQRETQDISLYRNTIKKQEEVITQYEIKFKTTTDRLQKQKNQLLEMEQLKTENMKLQKELKDMFLNNNINPGQMNKGNNELDKFKREIMRQDGVIKSLQNDLANKRPMSTDKKLLQSELMERDVQLHKANSRIQSLEEELRYNEKRNASEIARLKMIVAEKETTLDTLRMENIN